MKLKTLEKCFKGTIDKEMGTIVDTVEDRIRNANLFSINNTKISKIKIAIRSTKSTSGRAATSVMASSECGEHIRIIAPHENISEGNNTLHVVEIKDETRTNIRE